MALYSPPGVMLNNCLIFGLFWGQLFKFGIAYKKSVHIFMFQKFFSGF